LHTLSVVEILALSIYKFYEVENRWKTWEDFAFLMQDAKKSCLNIICVEGLTNLDLERLMAEYQFGLRIYILRTYRCTFS
jgi:hypothetical protein